MARTENRGPEPMALFKNETNLPQILLDVTINGVTHDKIRILPGSRIELPVRLGVKYRKALTRVVEPEVVTETKPPEDNV